MKSSFFPNPYLAPAVLLALALLAAPAGAETIVDYLPPDARLVAGINTRALQRYRSYGELAKTLTQWPATADAFKQLDALKLRLLSTGTGGKRNVDTVALAWIPNKSGSNDLVLILSGGFLAHEINAAVAQAHEGSSVETQMYEPTKSKIYTLAHPVAGYLSYAERGSTLIFATRLEHLHSVLEAAEGLPGAKGISTNIALAAVARVDLRKTDLFVAGLAGERKQPSTEAKDSETEKIEEPATGTVSAGPTKITSFLFTAKFPETSAQTTVNLKLQLHCSTNADADLLAERLTGLQQQYAKRWILLPAIGKIVSDIKITYSKWAGKTPVEVALDLDNALVVNLLKALVPPAEEEKPTKTEDGESKPESGPEESTEATNGKTSSEPSEEETGAPPTQEPEASPKEPDTAEPEG